jgi:predicted dehydrogenase
VIPLRWGVLGVSELVGRKAVLPALRRSPTAELVAIASRDPRRAEAEAEAFGAPRAYGSYAELVADPDVEAVYIPLPNGLHLEWTLASVAAGKHVLCEKPLACTAADARVMADAAREAGVILMEAYMTAFHTRAQRLVQLAREGVLGEVRSSRASFTFPNRDPANHRWLSEMGGGALLDVGIYCLEPLLAIGGDPVEVAAQQVAAASGVDTTFTGWLRFEGGATASFLVSFEAPEWQHLEVVGTQARLEVDTAFTAGPADRDIVLHHVDGRQEVIDGGACDSYLAMVEHFASAVRGEAALLRPPAASIRTLAVIDRLREAAGR